MKRSKNLRQRRPGLKMRNAISCARSPALKRSSRSRFRFSKNLPLRLKNARPLSKIRQSWKRSRL